ncbi:DUF3379 family protein [Alteromonas sp. KUL49]|uniref:DUF3379 family protein n=1 Tax=Alteromonas sp. KUL49 TaxID=2480798 RepID=UPI00102EF9D8|nr:DUF3379 family protein [Alteromonas sp. KUL49]TAP41336.1 DUF3379 domain-containing protein [Alteromonas sp. KUL49]GEA10404.1 hypothetical protein KUL49_07790 [Alteromonas sp. KUL49]
MDELEFRRRIYADPNTTDSDVIEAAKNNEKLRAFWNEQKALDNQLKQVLNVSVPDDLAHKLIWQQSANDLARHKHKTPWYIGLAASVAFVMGVGVMSWVNKPVSLDVHALAHMQYAQTEQAHSPLPVDLAQVNAKLASFGAEFTGMIGDVQVANYCHLNMVRSLHLIMDTPEGKMSVFIVPQRNDVDIPDSFSDTLYRGESMRMQRANVLVVGDKASDLSEVKQLISERMQFSA